MKTKNMKKTGKKIDGKITLKVAGVMPFERNVILSKDEYIELLEASDGSIETAARRLAEHLGVPDDKICKLALSEVSRGDQILFTY